MNHSSRHVAAVLASLSCLLHSAAVAGQAQPLSCIEGIVRSSDGRPVAGTVVAHFSPCQNGGRYAVTYWDGTFRIDRVLSCSTCTLQAAYCPRDFRQESAAAARFETRPWERHVVELFLPPNSSAAHPDQSFPWHSYYQSCSCASSDQSVSYHTNLSPPAFRVDN